MFTLIAFILTLAGAGLGSRTPGWPGSGQWRSPRYTWLFQYPLPTAPTASPAYTQQINGTTVNFYELSIERFQQHVYPNLGPANLAGYNGMPTGPTFRTQRGEESVVRLINNNNLAASMHLHGAWTRSPWDGWADNMIQPGQFIDYYYTETQTARTLWYHDHANHQTAVDTYYGQTGFHIISDSDESSLGLPSGQYDVPLSIIDKRYQSNGDLVSPAGETTNFLGDVIHVNGQPWPYLNVEPRVYRFRILDGSLSRPYTLYFASDQKGSAWQNFKIIGSDGGLFGQPVTTNSLTLSMGERYEVLFDFSGFKGQNITLMNHMLLSDISEYDDTDQIMRFVVGNTVSDSSNNNQPASLVSPSSSSQYPPQDNSVDHIFNFQRDGSEWTINGVTYDDPNARILARPPMGTVENWQLNYASGPGVHPVHIHLVSFKILSRTGRRGLQPYESAGLKDVVLLEPGESVNVAAIYGPWNGMYQFHCHNLIHEDHEMMDVFNVTAIEDLGYNLTEVLTYDDPTDPRYAAKDYDAQRYGPEYITKTLLPTLVGSDAYRKLDEVVSAESSYYMNHPSGETPAARVRREVEEGTAVIVAAEATPDASEKH